MKKTINDKLLEKLIKTSNKPILIKFWAVWCIPCKIIDNILKEIKKFFKKKLILIKINIDLNYYTVEKFSIKNIPTIIIIKNKNIIKKKHGFINKEYVKNIIKNLI